MGPSLPSYKGKNTLERFLLRGLIGKGTCATDENKRMAFVATDPYLGGNGSIWIDFMVKASQRKVFRKELIFEWILEA